MSFWTPKPAPGPAPPQANPLSTLQSVSIECLNGREQRFVTSTLPGMDNHQVFLQGTPLKIGDVVWIHMPFFPLAYRHILDHPGTTKTDMSGYATVSMPGSTTTMVFLRHSPRELINLVGVSLQYLSRQQWA